jgi:hypothetical protein
MTTNPQVSLPKTAGDVPGPALGTAMTKEYVQTIGRMAYIWGWPLVNMANRNTAFSKAPEPGLMGGVLPMAYNGVSMLTGYISPEQHFVTCPNQDVVYGFGFADLDKESIVFQVPDFGDRFWVYALYDARTDQFAEIGKAYGTTPGFYLIVGPNWKGDAPAGITAVVRSSTPVVALAPRIFMADSPEDQRAIQSVLNQVVFYKLTEFDGTMKTKDWTKTPHFPAAASSEKGETKWVIPDVFFDQLPAVMKQIAPLPGEEALYQWIGSVLDAAADDPQIKQTLKDTAIVAERELIGPFFHWKNNGRSAGNGWNSPVNNAQWGTDYANRAGTAKSNMYDNKPAETKYIYRDLDSQGQQLHGKHSYTVTFPKGQEPPVKGFWSITLYNEHHLFSPNVLSRYSLGTKSQSFLQHNPDGSLTLYFGATSPGKDKETNWVPAPDGTFSLYLRCYWADQAVIDATWMPPNVEKVR